MNLRKIYIFFTGFLILVSTVINAQDVGYSQFYSNPLYLNPAFAGTLDVPRINLHYRDQWHALSGAYVTQSASLDFSSAKLRGGIGINLIKDAVASNLLTSYQLDVMYAPVFKIKQDLFFTGAIQAGYHQNSLDWNNLIFPDNLDPYSGIHGITAETPVTDPTYRYFDFATGILIFGEKMFAGVAAHHLSEPSQSWYGVSDAASKLKRKYTLHFGTRIPIFVNGWWRKTFDLSPQVILMQQGSFRQFNYGLLANYKGFTAGTWLRQDLTFHYDALIFLIGYMKKRWHFTYSYDFTVSGLGAQSGGTSEISLSFLLKEFTRETAFPFYRPYHDNIGQ